MKLWVGSAGLFGGLLLAVDAATSHGTALDQEAMRWIDLASSYGMIHAVAMIAVGLLAFARSPLHLVRRISGTCFLLGILFFSGGLVTKALTGSFPLSFLIPVGGALQILGWFLLAIFGLSCKATNERSVL
ncbi:DUF423 domain-containing protein [Kiloniella sp. b19]|uniref:DUF423 domain-containing protein n=1 Tax=Kiloniella sp. GXU_MW_B19 TaxID=3141326 RepID=UPI0031D945DD